MSAADILTAAFLRIRPRLSATARRLTPRGDEADDLVQEAFCRLWGKRGAIDSDTHAEGALMTTLRNVCIDSLRRSHDTELTAEFSEPAAATTDADCGYSELYDRVSAIIDRSLSERDREILLLRDRNGYEIDALAARFDTSEANIRLILSRARRTVRDIYRNQTPLR